MAKKATYKLFNGTAFEDIYFKTSVEQVEGLQDALSNIPNESNFVKITGAQQIAGVKTFNSIPILPSTTPSNVNHAASKGYVDTTVSNKTDLKSNTDNRDVITIPNDYNAKFDIKGLKRNATLGITGQGSYSTLLGIRGWTDSSGGNSHEIALTGDGEIYHRHGATTTWNPWNILANRSWVTANTRSNAWTPTWEQVTGLETELNKRADRSHYHMMSQVTGLDTALEGKADTDHSHTFAQVPGLSTALNGKAATSHEHTIDDVTGLQAELDGLQEELDDKADYDHNHSINGVTGLSAALSGKASSAHTHKIGDVEELQMTLSGKASSLHTHKIDDVTGLQSALDGKSGTGHTHSAATQSAAGFLSKEDKIRLDGIETGAQVNVGTNLGINRTGTTNVITSSTGNNTTIPGATASLAGLVTNGAQTWSGVKTFNSIPILPSTTPSNVNHVASKGYVDSRIGSVYRPAGDWNAATNTPKLTNITPANAGKVYRVSVAGTQFGFTFAIGDKLTFNEDGVISKWDNVDDVVSVNGQTGTVVLQASDVGAADRSHYHTQAQVTGLTAALEGKADTDHSHTFAQVSGLSTALNGKANSTHSHTIANVTGLQAALDGKAAYDHKHSINSITGLSVALSGKAATSHGHIIDDVEGLETALAGKATRSHYHMITQITGLQAELDGKASSAHTHKIGDVEELQIALNGKAASSHSHTIANVTGLQAALDGKAAYDHKHSISSVTNLSEFLDEKASKSYVNDAMSGTMRQVSWNQSTGTMVVEVL